MKAAVAVMLALPLMWGCLSAEEDMPPTIQDVKARNAPSLLALPGVVSVGIGRDSDGQDVIAVGLDRARPETQAHLPTELEGYRVRLDIIGAVRAH